MSVFSGDFLGFQLGDIHSSQLNITRVSDGDRYNENLTPNFNDVTEQIPGADGVYYWNTYYTQRNFTINFAFDDLHDEDIRRLKQVLNFKGIQPLIFDESLYKKYYVKCSAPPTLKYICFTDKETKVYKGEGNINLVTYYPYGVSTTDISIKGKEGENLNIVCYNIGDLPTSVKLIYNTEIAKVIRKIKLKDTDKELNFKFSNTDFSIEDGNRYICVDMRTHLIEGLNENFQKTGRLYNYAITSGDFFELPVGENIIEHKNNSNGSVIYKYQGRNDYTECKFNYLYY